MALGDKIKEARKRKGLTQKQLADMIDAKHNSISNWENNQNKPDPDTIELLCGVLDVSPSYLLNGNIPIALTTTNFDENKSNRYSRIISYLDMLNDYGIKEVEKRIRELSYIPEYQNEVFQTVAAHAIENSSKEDHDYDEQLIKDDINNN